MFKKLSGLDTVAKKKVVFTLPQIDFPRTQHPPWLQNIRNGNPRLQNLRNWINNWYASNDPRERQRTAGRWQVGPEQRKKLLFAHCLLLYNRHIASRSILVTTDQVKNISEYCKEKLS